MRTAGLTILFAALCSAPSHAQSTPYQAAAPAGAAVLLASGPAVQPSLQTNADFLAERRFSSRAPGATMMIIGGAAIVGGILVGGSGGAVLILGGIGVGAYGFYLYTR